MDEALRHPLFKNLHDPKKVRSFQGKGGDAPREYSAQGNTSGSAGSSAGKCGINFQFEAEADRGELTEPKLRLYFLQLMQKFHPEMRIPGSLLRNQ